VLRLAQALCFILVVAELSAQEGRGLTTQVYGGFLFPHHEEMKRQEQHTKGIEFAWYAKGTGYTAMDKHFWNPRWGLGALYLDLGDTVNGKVMGPHVFIEFDLKKQAKHPTTLRFASGLGYFTRPFDPVKNPRNRANGSEVNGLMQILLTKRVTLGHGLECQGGMGITHYSNGNWKYPNYGINMLMLHGGISWFPWKANAHTSDWPKLNSDNPILRSHWSFSARTGKRQIAIDDRRNFTMFMGDIVYHRSQSKSRLWRFGFNYHFDPVYPYIKFGPWPVQNRKFGDVSEFSLAVGHEYRVGRIGLTGDFGFYLYRPTESKRMYYEALGFKIYANDRLFFMNRLRVHLFTADYIEWGIGWNIYSRRVHQPLFNKEFIFF
jgi:hypothetical protein